MNAPTRCFALLGLVAALPVIVTAQSADRTPSSAPSSSTATSPASGSGRHSRDAGSYASSSSASGATDTGSSRGGAMDATSAAGTTLNIQRVGGETMASQLTAKALIGKDVYDNHSKKVGEVRDIVLDPSRAPELASAIAGHARNGEAGMPGATTGLGQATTVPGNTNADARVSGAITGDASANGSTSSVAANSGGSDRAGGRLGRAEVSRANSGVGETLSSLASTASAEPAAIISYGGFMGAGGTLFRVPLSQLHYDAANDRISLKVSDSQLSSLANPDAVRGAAE